jgi:hypothetical protein
MTLDLRGGYLYSLQELKDNIQSVVAYIFRQRALSCAEKYFQKVLGLCRSWRLAFL